MKLKTGILRQKEHGDKNLAFGENLDSFGNQKLDEKIKKSGNKIFK